MDYRLLLFLQTFSGLKLSAQELKRLLDPHLDVRDPHSVFDGLDLQKQPGQIIAEGERVIERSIERGIRWSYLGQPDYPDAWLGLSIRPLVFSYLGNPIWLTMPLVSVVGSRTPMRDTYSWMQNEFTRFLKYCPVGVVSGGARGVDQWAHRLAIDAGRCTACVFPSGLLNPYPVDQQKLWDQIVDQNGVLISSFGLDQPMRKALFHTRNRWIAGLSQFTFVAEANRRSGSYLTATLARDEAREVCALPVSPHAEQGLANLDLIQGGAQLIRDYRDLITMLGRNC